MAAKKPIERVQDWWAIILIVIGVIGGYLWLDKNYAHINKLHAEKCSLSYEIKLIKAEIKFDTTDEKRTLQQNELEALLQMSDPPQGKIEFKRSYIKRLDDRLTRLDEYKACLTDRKLECFQGKYEINRCSSGEGG